MKFQCRLIVIIAVGLAAPICGRELPAKAPEVAGPWLDLAVTYVVHAKSIWHEADVGGYWGGGLAEKNGNGRVRGMCNTTLAYAFVVRALDAGWLTGAERTRLESAGLNRKQLVANIDASLRFLCAHHVAAADGREPRWGNDWQSSLWLGAAGVAVFLVWDDLDDALKREFAVVAASEANRLAAKPPANYRPGNTGAEENGWDTHALALALALEPRAPDAGKWERALRRYAVNVYSVKSDATDDRLAGEDRIRDIVSTANLFPDFTLQNHRFFHPDYIQVSGQLLGEALLILELGDRRHGTKLADSFRPYALHHALEVWERVMHPLLLPDGELAFPCGQDWTLNTSVTPAYLAYISTLLGDPDAAHAGRVHPAHALRRRAMSPPDRILGDTNLEWWWEPIVIKRGAMAVLQHALRPRVVPPATAYHGALRFTATRLWPDAKIWLYRNEHYFVSAAWGARAMATFTPFDGPDSEEPFVTLPLEKGLLPDVTEAEPFSAADSSFRWLSLKVRSGGRCVIVALPQSILMVSTSTLRPLGIENDPFTGGRRAVHSGQGTATVVFSDPSGPAPLLLDTKWLNIDDRLGMVTGTPGFIYTPASGFNRRAAAVDNVVPQPGNAVAWQLIPNATRERTAKLAEAFSADVKENGSMVTVRDPSGRTYRVHLPSDSTPVRVQQIRER